MSSAQVVHTMLQYAIITPAHNEEQHLERLARSVTSQTQKPVGWLIVDDGSTDRTREIADRVAAEWPFVRVVSTERRRVRTFGHKAQAFNIGVEHLRHVDYQLIGNLDADVSFDEQYFADLIDRFRRDSTLGITGGTVFTKIGDRFVTHDMTNDSVAGAVQLFRKECLRDIGGGYLSLTYGGIDAAAEIIAKTQGWKVEKSKDNPVYEHRQTGTADHTPLAASVRLGRRFHSLGYGQLFYFARCLYRVWDAPVVLGSCAELWGYLESMARRRPIQLPKVVVRRLRKEQRRKLLSLATGSRMYKA